MPTELGEWYFKERHKGGLHESVFRSYAVVQKLRELIEAKTPHAVLLEILNDLTGR